MLVLRLHDACFEQPGAHCGISFVPEARNRHVCGADIAGTRRGAKMHWGGGTPTHLTSAEINDIAAYIRRKFSFREDAEISAEIDPRGLTRAHIEALHANGFNRASIGVQDFNPSVQQAVNRVQPESDTANAIQWCRELGFTSINLDLIYGLPHQNPESFEATLTKLLEFSPDRIAVYNFAHVPWLKPHQNLISPADLPSPEEKLDILL